MPTYRVGVLLTASGGSFQRGMRAAAGTTRQAQSALQRAGGAATAFGRRSDEAGRQAQSALQRASGSVRGLQSSLQRTSNQARRTGSAIDAAAGRSDRKVRGLIQRFRELGRAIRESRAGTQGGGALGGGALARAAGAVGGGFALSRAAGEELSLDDRFTRLAIDAKKNDQEALQTRRHIEAVAGNVRIPVSELLAAVEEYVGRTGDFETAISNLETTGQAIQRLGAAGTDIGAVGAQLRKGGIRSGDDYRQAILKIVESEREGALKGRDLARTAAEALSLMFAIPGQQGLPALDDFLVLAQMGMVGTGDPHKSMTALRSVFAAAQDPAKLKEMQKLGVYGAAERSPLKVLEELVAATGGSIPKLGRIYEREGQAIPAMFTTEEGRDVRRRVAEGVANADEELFETDVERLGDQLSAKIQAFRDRMQSRFSRILGGPMEDVAATAFGLEDLLLPGLGAAVAGRAAWRGGRRGLDAWRRWRGGGGSGVEQTGSPRGRAGRAGAAIPATGVVHTMRVTTLIAGSTVGGGLAGAAGRSTGAARRAGGGGFLARAAGRASGVLQRAGGVLRRVPVAGLVLGGAGIAASVAQGDRTGAAVQAGGLAGGAGGAALGGAVGGAIGSIVPVLGTAIGAGIGSVLGGYFGANFGADQTASALERAANMDAETRDSRRAEARRRWMEGDVDGGDGSGDGAVEPAAPELGRDELRRLMREDFMAARGGQVNSNNTRTVHIDSPVFQVRSETGDPVEIGDALFEQLMERVREELRHDEERIVNLTYSDPDPTLLF